MRSCPTQRGSQKPKRAFLQTGHFLKTFFKRFYLFIFRESGREGERERNIKVWLPLTCPLLGTWPTTQACALTRNRTDDPLVHRLALNPLSHTSWGQTGYSSFSLHYSPSFMANFMYSSASLFREALLDLPRQG